MRPISGKYSSHVVVIILAALLTTAVSCSSDDSPAAPTTDLGKGLLGLYNFDGSAADASGHGRDGTLLGGATVDQGYLALGVNDQDALSLPASMIDGLGDFTFASWVRLGTTHVWPSQWISGATSAEDNNLGIWYDPNNSRWSMDLFGDTYDFDDNSVVEDMQWHHVVVTRAGAKAALYIDGAAVTTGLDVNADPVDVDDTGFIVGQDQDTLGGGFATDNSLSGDVDQLRIYNRALSAAEAKALAGIARE